MGDLQEKLKKALRVITAVYAVYKFVMVIIGLVHSANIRPIFEELLEGLSDVEIVIVNDPSFAGPVHLLCSANDTLSSNYTDCQSVFDEYDEVTGSQEYWSMLYLDPRDSTVSTKVKDMVSARHAFFIGLAIFLSLTSCISCLKSCQKDDETLQQYANWGAFGNGSQNEDNDIEMSSTTSTTTTEAGQTVIVEKEKVDEADQQQKVPKWAKVSWIVMNGYNSAFEDVARMFFVNLYTLGVDGNTGVYIAQYVPGYPFVLTYIIMGSITCCCMPCTGCAMFKCYSNDNLICLKFALFLCFLLFLAYLGSFTLPAYGLMYYVVNFSLNIKEFTDEDPSLSEELALDLADVVDGTGFISIFIPLLAVSGLIFTIAITTLKVVKVYVSK